LERLFDIRLDLDSDPPVCRRPQREDQLQPASQGLSHPPETAAGLSNLRSAGGAERNREGDEYAKDSYVLVDDEEIKKVALRPSMEILEFVSSKRSIHYTTTCLITQCQMRRGHKPYHLLVKTMEESLASRPGENRRRISASYTVLVGPINRLTLHTMYYSEDIRAVAEYCAERRHQGDRQEVGWRKLVKPGRRSAREIP
jgi:hypothetical protein